MNPAIHYNDEEIARFCRDWAVAELAVFGSALRDDFGPGSDIDVLVSFAPGARPTLFDLAEMREQLVAIFGRPVDLVSRRAVESSRNRIRREAILSRTETIHAA